MQLLGGHLGRLRVGDVGGAEPVAGPVPLALSRRHEEEGQCACGLEEHQMRHASLTELQDGIRDRRAQAAEVVDALRREDDDFLFELHADLREARLDDVIG